MLPGGEVDAGAWVRGVMDVGCCAAVGPDGTAYVQGDDGIWAIDLDGERPGFPLRIDGWASAPAFGADGRLYMTVDVPDDAEGPPSSQVVAFTPQGQPAPGWPITLPIDAWTTFGDPTAPPLPPVVAADGTVYVTGWTGWMDRTIVYALGPSGARRPGWPYRAEENIRWGRPNAFTCSCEPCVLPGLFVDTPPTGGPDGSLLLSQSDGLVVVRRNGTVKRGWPVTPIEPKSSFYEVALGGAGTAYAYAAEPAGSTRNPCGEKVRVSRGTVIALDRHGDAIYTTTLVAP